MGSAARSNQPRPEPQEIFTPIVDPKLQAKSDKEQAAAAIEELKRAKTLRAQREVQFKASHTLLLTFLAWIFVLHAIGLYFFTKGFLLTRLVLDDKSDCAVLPIESYQQEHSPRSASEGCWHPKVFDKAVVIIVDALRYDFVVPYPPIQGQDELRHFHNALPLFHETATNSPHNAFLRPFIADPPTATLQRLKGLTTGTLPTFIDVGSNFAGTAIEEDNLIAQLRDAGKNVVHLGDDTWHKLFPDYFDPALTRAYDSFNVWDLHTVDNGVSEHLLPLLDPVNATKWDVVFAHYLGVDHAGHRYGPDHPAMTDKLQQMDTVLRRVVELIDDKTLLVVMGDHGMDAKGDHGGESDDEVEAALWMYSKAGLFGRSVPEHVEPPRTAKERPVGQIDLVPTLALLLGLPIPFNNLGSPIEEAFIGNQGKDWGNMALVNRIASAQIKRYQHQYALARGLDESTATKPLLAWGEAEEQFEKAKKAWKPNLEQWHEASQSFSRHQQETLNICRALWARFDVPSMIHGIAILAAGVIALVIYARSFREDTTALTPAVLLRVLVGSGFGSAAGVFLGFIGRATLLNAVLSGFAVGGVIGFLQALFAARESLSSPVPKSFWGWLAVVFTVAPSIGFASNSYTIWEDEIMLFFLTSFGVLAFISSLRQRSSLDRALGTYHSGLFIIISRIASFSRLCREEQMPFCKSTYYASATSSTSAPWQLAIPFAVAILLPDFIKTYYKGTRSYEGTAVFWIGIALRLGLLLSALYWTLDAADDGGWLDIGAGIMKTVRVFIAQLVLGLALAAGTTAFTLAQPCINIISDKDNNPSDSADSSSPSSPSSATVKSSSKQSITILGYANIHGSRYYLLVTNWLLAIVLLQKPMGGGTMGLLAWQILSLMEIIDTNDLSSSAIGPIVLGVLGSFYFFKTGHQAVLSTIQWESAFIPTKTVRYPFSPILVVLNTYGAQILAAIAVPLVVLWKQSPRRQGLLGDITKAVATHILFYAVIALATAVWAGYLRRHLMLFRIFSPRFMMAGTVLLVVDVAIAAIAVGAVRVNILSVAQLFGLGG
ncbi:putative phosphoethanolamine N-methyltransferase [Xylona heveae TC161]|uniref:Putative phosphoethanolamine N-methyltransferase n=1 Tax=Xylona heveae (strain CBS 132557 / TC161) TaxID=1328760 RepID=A0A165FTP7_XYLHT|nr:putative phosphoethanolamine N-methyltransferase [Xylona heveae TC161]KZF21364.1 putative phosphoethanolamine N-methyltransferase [Xylona heveae TC161]